MRFAFWLIELTHQIVMSNISCKQSRYNNLFMTKNLMITAASSNLLAYGNIVQERELGHYSHIT